MFPLCHEIICPDRYGSLYTLQVRQRIDHTCPLPLMERGWFFQERLLSRRLLHFGHGELIWECMEGKTCECQGINPSASFWQGKLELHNRDLSYLIPDGLMEVWHRIVDGYSRKKLTYESDQLPALSGAAKRMQKYRSATYLAGIWGDSILRDLLWEARSPSKPKLTHWRAPSWSWASVGGPISYPLCHAIRYTYVRIDGAECTPAGMDPTGEVSSGRIQLAGHVQPVKLVPAAKEDRTRFKIENALGQTSLFDGDYNFLDGTDDRIEYDSTIYSLKIVLSMDSMPMSKEGYIVISDNVDRYETQFDLWSLILRCIDEHEKVFMRIGIQKVGFPFREINTLRDATRSGPDTTITLV
jgi:hypothetical protein